MRLIFQIAFYITKNERRMLLRLGRQLGLDHDNPKPDEILRRVFAEYGNRARDMALKNND